MAEDTFQYNRTKKCFRVLSSRKRTTTPPESYATKECCNPMLVLAKVGENESWKNDITSAWYKVTEDASDWVEFILYKKGDVQAIYQPSINKFSYDTAYYATIYWQSVISLDGTGCYYLKVRYNIDDEIKEFIWGEYNLQHYSLEKAKSTVRVKAEINQYFGIDDINFKDSNLVDCLRFNGYFGDMIPNFKIDNLIYENRRFENVQRERIATYTLRTDPLMYNMTDMLINVYLLAENKIFISDYNSFNHSWFYKDIELIVSNSPEIDYQEFSRLASVTCEFTDKTRDNLAKYV